MDSSRPTAPSTASALRFLVSYLWRHKLPVATGIIVLILVDTTQLLIPRVIQVTLDSLQSNKESGHFILQQSILILGMAFAMMCLRFLWRFLISGTSRRIEHTIRQDVFKHLQTLPFSYYNSTKTGEIMALLINDIGAIRLAAGPALIGITDTIFLGSMTITFMLSINVQLTIFSVSPMLLIIIFLLIFGRTIQHRFERIQEAFASISAQAQEVFSGIRIVKGFGHEYDEDKRFKEECDKYVTAKLKLEKLWSMVFPMVGMVASASIVVFLLVGGRLALLGDISIGQFVSFSFYIMNLIWPMIAIGWVFNILQRGLASSKRVMKILNTNSEINDKDIHSEAAITNGDITISNLNFSYHEEQPVLKDISLHIPGGSTLGIMGKPGSGKTTLVSLLFRLFPLPDGSIVIDGNDVNHIGLERLRNSIGFVPQDSFLFADTIAENILLGLKCGTTTDQPEVMEQVKVVTRTAAMSDSIENFPDGYQTVIGERGITLSGGQKQRIALARALITDPVLLILDDAFSAVDTATEQTILSRLKPQLLKRTSILIAHRISTVMHCDQIIILDEGRIIEQGTHGDLLKQDGWYARLYHLQQLEEGFSSET